MLVEIFLLKQGTIVEVVQERRLYMLVGIVQSWLRQSK
jgi:hypothetical protein